GRTAAQHCCSACGMRKLASASFVAEGGQRPTGYRTAAGFERSLGDGNLVACPLRGRAPAAPTPSLAARTSARSGGVLQGAPRGVGGTSQETRACSRRERGERSG